MRQRIPRYPIADHAFQQEAEHHQSRWQDNKPLHLEVSCRSAPSQTEKPRIRGSSRQHDWRAATRPRQSATGIKHTSGSPLRATQAAQHLWLDGIGVVPVGQRQEVVTGKAGIAVCALCLRPALGFPHRAIETVKGDEG